MRVLLIFPGALGDCLLLAPAATELFRRGIRVEWSVRRVLARLVSALSAGGLGPPLDGAAMSSLFTIEPSHALAEWLSGADEVHAWLGADGGGSTLADHVRDLGVGRLRFHGIVRGEGSCHAATEYAAALGIGGSLPPPALVLPPSPAQPAWDAPWAARLVLHPGAGAVTKRWTFPGFMAVADGWRAAGGEVTVLLGPAEEGIVGQWQETGLRLAPDLDVLGAATLLASAPTYLGNDSGISHLAGVLHRSGVVLFGATRPERWRPLGGSLVPLCFTSRAEKDVMTAILQYLDDARAGLQLP